VFTGIVQAIGRIASATPHGDGLRIAVDTVRWAATQSSWATASRWRDAA